MTYKLDQAQRNELKRLTQKANRRIKSYMASYEQAGHGAIPKKYTGGFDVQIKEQWAGKTQPLSRSVKFNSQKEFNKHISTLKANFDQEKNVNYIPTPTQTKKIDQLKLEKALRGAGLYPNRQLLNKMSMMDLKQFWDTYEIRAVAKGLVYASNDILKDFIGELSSKEDEDAGIIVQLAKGFK